jgi:hypothetical protein
MSFPYSGNSWCAERVAVSRGARIKAVIVANKGIVPFWLWICDSPSAATAPSLSPIYVVPASTQSLDIANSPVSFASGVYVCATTDPATKTLITGNDAFFTVIYDHQAE